jgi:hypothetical protein
MPTWPADLQTMFDICRRQLQPLGTHYCAPYNQLLTHCFGGSDFFVTLPPGALTYHETADPITFPVVIDARGRPVLVIGINDDALVNTADLRIKAEDQMRQQYNAMLPDCPLPRLWGLSFLGTSFRVYTGDVASGEVDPAFTDPPSSTDVLSYDFLQEAWNIDIFSQEGFNKMKEIVGDIISTTALERA